jgi:hypothetical protein
MLSVVKLSVIGKSELRDLNLNAPIIHRVWKTASCGGTGTVSALTIGSLWTWLAL